MTEMLLSLESDVEGDGGYAGADLAGLRFGRGDDGNVRCVPIRLIVLLEPGVTAVRHVG